MEPSQLQKVQPASLLWAHELRRENVHLVSQMDKLNTILTSATNTISTLHESVEILTARMQHLEEQHRQQQQDFEHKIIEFEDDRRESQSRAVRLEQAYEQVDTLVVENGALRRELTDIREKVDAVETGNGTLREEVGQASKKVDTVESGNKTLARELGKASRELHALIAENEGLLKGEIQGVSEKFDTFETENGTLKWNLDNVIQTFGRIESENDGVKERVCVLEKGAAVQEKHTARLMKWMSMKTMGENKETRWPRRAAADQDQDIHMPDSIPTPASRQSARLSSQRMLSDTTWGLLTDLDRPCTSVSNKNSGHGSQQKVVGKNKDQKILESIRQERRTLGEYISLTDALRVRHTSIPEEAFVMAFMAGLDDDDLRMKVIDVTRQAGLSWDSVMSCVMSSVQSKGQGSRERADSNNKHAPGRRNGAVRLASKRKENRRRTIPIVPADEEDELFVT